MKVGELQEIAKENEKLANMYQKDSFKIDINDLAMKIEKYLQ